MKKNSNWKGKFLVKVQVSLYTTESKPQILIYNEDHSIFFQGDMYKGLEKRIKEPKKFWWAHVSKKNMIVLDKPAPWQDW